MSLNGAKLVVSLGLPRGALWKHRWGFLTGVRQRKTRA
jgi:hypothetical protein